MDAAPRNTSTAPLSESDGLNVDIIIILTASLVSVGIFIIASVLCHYNKERKIAAERDEKKRNVTGLMPRGRAYGLGKRLEIGHRGPNV